MPPDLEHIRATAERIARLAGALLIDARQRPVSITNKGTVDLVTETDKAAEKLIAAALREAFPDHALQGEEGTDVRSTAGLTWFIDPIDGTTNFSRGFPFFCTSLGLADAQGPLVGAVYDPMRGEMFSAARGHGATLNGQPIHAAGRENLIEALLVTGFAYDRQIAQDNNIRAMDMFIRRALDVRRSGSAALDLCYVACGRLDGYWEPVLNPWDVAGGAIIAREAGAVVTGYKGTPQDDILGRLAPVVCANPALHPQLIAALHELYPELK